MSVSALRFTGVSKSYGSEAVLRDINLNVARSEFFGLVGANGAGKTTLLKCLLDLCDTARGTIEIFGVGHRLAGARGRLSYLPERFNPPYFLSGEQFIRYILNLQSASYEGSAVRETLAAFDLEPSALARPVRTYSKGMTQKLGLISCFLANKDLYVLDEPTSGLDPKARALFKAHLKGLKAQARTVLFTSHVLADVEELCDRIGIMHAGQLRFVGTPEALCCRFSTDDVETAFLQCIADPATAPS